MSFDVSFNSHMGGSWVEPWWSPKENRDTSQEAKTKVTVSNFSSGSRMGKVSPKEKMSKTSSKQKRRIHGSNKYLKPGALAQLRINIQLMYNTNIGKKKVDVMNSGKTHGDVLFQDKCANDIPIILSPAKLRYNFVLDQLICSRRIIYRESPRNHAMELLVIYTLKLSSLFRLTDKLVKFMYGDSGAKEGGNDDDSLVALHLRLWKSF
ncbi:hypothetical protein OSB04_015525, partial [Centaurea solstitialis]